MREFRDILLIKPSSLGDIIHALPTAVALRRIFPEASLTWLVKREWADVLVGNPFLDRVLAVELSVAAWPAAVRAVRCSRFDLVVDLQGLLRSAVLGWLSRAPVRIGFANAREGSPWLYTERVLADWSLHAVDRYLLVARFLGAQPGASHRLEFPLPKDHTAEARVSGLLATEGISTSTTLIALNPGARWPTKQWPVTAFAAVGDRLQKQGVRVAVIGRAGDAAGREVLRHMRSKPIDLLGKTGLKELVAVLRRAHLLITNDSGPMHVASALGTPVLALFGPTDPARTGPYGRSNVVLRTGVSCSPCLSRRCTNPSRLECLTTINPEHVLEQALGMVGRQPVSNERSVVGVVYPPP